MALPTTQPHLLVPLLIPDQPTPTNPLRVPEPVALTHLFTRSPSPSQALLILPDPDGRVVLVTPYPRVFTALACSLVCLPHGSGTATVSSLPAPCT